MPATTQKKFKKPIFKVAKELNITTDRVVEFLEAEGYGDALKGSGLTAKIVSEEAYLVLRQEYADDAEAAARVRELRRQEADSDGVDRDEVTAIQDAAAEAEAAVEEAEAEAPAAAEAAEAPEAAPEAKAPAEAAPEAEAPEAADAEAAEPVAETPDEEAPTAAAEPATTEPATPAPAEAAVDAGDTPHDVVAEVAPEEATPEEATPEEAALEAEAEPVAEAPAAEAPAADAPAAGASAAEEEAAAPEETPALAEEALAEEKAPEPTAEAEEDVPVAATPEAKAEAVTVEVEDDAPVAHAETSAAAETEPAEAEAAEAEAAEAKATPDEATAPEAEEEADEADEEAAAAATPDEAETADAEEDEDDEEEEEGTLKANRYRLSGPSVVGKVDLSTLEPRRRRKRKKKKKEEKKEEKKRTDREQAKPKREKKKRKKKRRRDRGVDEEDVEATIQETLQELEQGASRARQRRRRRRRERHAIEREEERQRRAQRESIVRVTEFVSTGELANLMGEPVTDVIKTLFEAGMMVSINQRLDADTIQFIAAEYGVEVEFIDEFSSTAIELEEDDPEDLRSRAPVVTVMGHVDHGKTSLLDYVRKANVVAGEAGGITQHIGAYRVELTDMEGQVTFLDTPGHEAFTAMRARGAKATDVVILVVAADDAVMPQTIEAINHSQAADVPIVVAINKIDKPAADPQRVMTELAEHNVLVEDYGGAVQSAQVSAKTGEGIDDLMEKVVLQAELLELKANPNRMSAGTIIESRLEKGRGNVVTVLVQNGTLKVGDPFVAGIFSGRVRAMFDERDQRIKEAGPSTPALVLGCDGSPEVGDQFVAMEDEGVARDIAQRRQQIHREQQLRQKSQVSLEQVSRRMAEGEFQELNLIVKADVGGSVEALADALLKLKTDEVAVSIIHSGVGAINESDVMLARASEAVIIGFQVRPTVGARTTAEQEEIDIRTYSVIYDAIGDVHDALEGLLSPERREETKGYAEVRDIFKVPSVGTVGGCYVTEGTISRNHHIRVVREGVVIYDGEIGSLKRFQDDVKEVQQGYECGLSVQNFNDIKVGDELETYVVVEEKRTLEV